MTPDPTLVYLLRIKARCEEQGHVWAFYRSWWGTVARCDWCGALR